MIEFNKVSKYFGETKALINISFKAKKGEIIGFLGPNGAGKTTAMRIIVGYLKPTLGWVKVNNADPVEDRVLVLSKIGYLPENNPLYHEMKVHEYLRFVSKIKDSHEDNIKHIITEVGLEAVINSKIEKLSRGFKQRAGLAAALLGAPEVLILDEPTSGLDPLEQEKIRKLIKKLGKDKAVILSTHILSEVEDIATRLIIIDKGHIVYDGKKPKGKGKVDQLFRKLVK